MYLAIDIGNTRTKAGVFNNAGSLSLLKNSERIDTEEIIEIIETHSIKSAILSSVGSSEYCSILAEKIRTKVPLLILDAGTPLPISINYQNKETLGVDRIAAATAAHSLFPESDVLTIQAGTCIVCDLVTQDGVYRGGSISPGLDMRFAALHTFTNRLPLVSYHESEVEIGNSSETSILSGVFLGLVDEINGAISRYREQFPGIKIILTGGNKNILENRIKNTIFAIENLVLTGLYKILIFNAKDKI